MSRLFFILLISSCGADEPLTPVCESTCYTGPPETRNVGACRDGTPECDKDKNLVGCRGEVLPEPERCEWPLQDRNCNNIYGDGDFAVAPFATDNPCNQRGKCFATWYLCNEGTMYCDWPEGPPVTDRCATYYESCGTTTDDDFNGPPYEYCYTGPPETAVNGDCHPGVVQCIDGKKVCYGEVTPGPLRYCQDGADGDCDGFPDIRSSPSGTDIVFAIDVSISMVLTYDLLSSAICDFAQYGPMRGDDYRYALVLIAEPDGGFSLASNFTSADDLCVMLDLPELSGSIERTLDANLAIVDPANPLGLDWRAGATKATVLFGDEEAQSSCPDISCMNYLSDQVISSCAQSQISVYWFQDYSDYYERLSRYCGGNLFPLASSIEDMRHSLLSIFLNLCYTE